MTLRHAGLAATDVGCKRTNNEDSFLIDDVLGYYAVADGMGGHAAGEVASQMAVTTVQQLLAANAGVLQALATDASHDKKVAAEKLVERAIQEASTRIFEAARDDASRRGMGTTFDCVVVVGNRAVIGHVGDSRVYLVRQGKVHRLTEDHTMIAMAIKAGIVTKEDAKNTRFANSLTRAVGTQPSVQVDTLLVECQSGDKFLLCSDGLHGYIEDGETTGLLAPLRADEPPKGLIDMAKQRGGKDNITALVVGLTGDRNVTVATVEADTKMGILQQIPLFTHLSYKERSAVLAVSRKQTYAPGQIIVQEGTRGEDVFIVVTGSVVVEKAGVQIGTMGVGGHFGEMSLVDDVPRSATVRAASVVEVMAIARAEMMALMRKDQMLAVKLLWSFVQTISERLRQANAGMVEARAELSRQAPAEYLPFSQQDAD